MSTSNSDSEDPHYTPTYEDTGLPRRTRPRKGPPAKYPWNLYINGEWHEAKRHKDFTCTTHSFVSRLHNKAKQLGRASIWVETQTDSQTDTVRFRFTRTYQDG